MRDKDKLKKLVQIFGELLKVDGNEWLADEMLQIISEVAPVEEIAKHSLVQNIHEYCIEQKINQQSIAFYETFPIHKIKDQLISDYRKMEHERRRDDFQNFCLCLYQQIENITNFLVENEINKVWATEKDKMAVKSYYNSDLRKYVFPDSGGTTLEMLVLKFPDAPKLKGKSLLEWHAGPKFRSVVYFYYFGKNVIRTDYEFNRVCHVQNEIAQIRNQNHRGGKLTGKQQEIVNKIKDFESRYYFKFYGFLQDFVNKVESHYSTISSDLGGAKKSANKPEAYRNSIGELIPELGELRKKLDEK